MIDYEVANLYDVAGLSYVCHNHWSGDLRDAREHAKEVDEENATLRQSLDEAEERHARTVKLLDAEVDRLAGEVARLTQERDDARCWHPKPAPPVSPDRRACAGCVGPVAAGELQRRLTVADTEVARMQAHGAQYVLPEKPTSLADVLRGHSPANTEEACDIINAAPSFPFTAHVSNVSGDEVVVLTPVGTEAPATFANADMRKEVERLRRVVRRMGPPPLPHDALQDRTATPNERAYEALMAERTRRQRAGAEMGRVLRLAKAIARQQRGQYTQLLEARRLDETQKLNAEADAKRWMHEAKRLAANEAPLRAGYVEACAERDLLRKQVAEQGSHINSVLREGSRQRDDAHRRAAADCETYRGQARWLIDELARIDEIVSSGERPRVVVKRIAKLRTNAR